MVIAIDPKQPFDYTIEAERDTPETASVFKLRGLTERERSALADMMAVSVREGESGVQISGLATMKYEMLRLGLVGWSNVVSASGEQVPFTSKTAHIPWLNRKVDIASEASIDMLPPEVRSELTDQIDSRNKVGEDEGKL
jgi:hypothetical protein